jgi:hypothetical protein
MVSLEAIRGPWTRRLQAREARTLYRHFGRFGLQHHLRGMLAIQPRRGRSLSFSTHGNDALRARIMASGLFCRDTSTGAVLHQGQESLREIGPSLRLHVALLPGDQVLVHLDRHGPTAGTATRGPCRYDRTEAARHIVHDVLPALRLRRFGGSLTTGGRFRGRRREPLAPRGGIAIAFPSARPNPEGETGWRWAASPMEEGTGAGPPRATIRDRLRICRAPP